MKVIAFGAHPDDIEIGMGGTIVKHVRNGNYVLMVIATIPGDREQRMEEACKAAKILGADLYLMDIPPLELVYNRAIVQKFDKILHHLKPDLIYTHWDQDSHQDHNMVSRLVITASRENRSSLLMYEQTIPGGIVPGGFKAQSMVDISDYMSIKMEGIRVHNSQVRANGEFWIQGIEGRAMYRGYQINVRYAEAFEVVKEIDVHFRERS